MKLPQLTSLAALLWNSTSAATIENSKCFEAITAPDSKVTVYVLKGAAAEHQQVLYYTQDMMTRDGSIMWFTVVTNPGTPQARKVLGLWRGDSDSKTVFPDAKFEGESPWVDSETGTVYFCGLKSLTPKGPFPVYKLLPDPKAKPEKFAEIPRFEEGSPRQVMTHFSLNASRTAFIFDSGHYPKSEKTYYGMVPFKGGTATKWGEFGRRMDHALMSPTDDQLMLIVQDNFNSKSGVRIRVTNRMWLVTPDGKQEPIFSEEKGRGAYHEWWDVSGDYVWYVDTKGSSTGGRTGTAKVRLKDRHVELMWPGAVGHTHSTRDGQRLVGDHGVYKWKQANTVKVSAFDVRTQRELAIVPSMPAPRWEYHTHPHPQFDADDHYILFTCTLAGYTSVGVVKAGDVFGDN